MLTLPEMRTARTGRFAPDQPVLSSHAPSVRRVRPKLLEILWQELEQILHERRRIPRSLTPLNLKKCEVHNL
jgi:hypothetical protein